MELLLQTLNISKFFGAYQALNDVSISIKKGSIFGLLGPNGAGKTTLIRIITKIYATDSGKVLFNGKELTEADVLKMGYLPEERGLYKKMKVGEQLLYLAQLKGLKEADAKRRIKIWLEKFEASNWWEKKVEELSKGMQQKVQFIASIVHEPKLIILDEPFTGFDPVNINLIKKEILQLKREGCTIIFSTHRMDSVEELCDDIALINRSKKILEGHKEEIKKEYKQNIFEVEHFGALSDLNGSVNLVKSVNLSENKYMSTLQSVIGVSHNDLLKKLIDQVEIISFMERLPSINEIFINKVQGGEHE